MISKTIVYKDLDGKPVTDVFWFHLNPTELTEMEITEEGGLFAYFEKIQAEKDGAKIIQAFKMLLSNSIGRRHEDGKQFVKNQESRDAFMQSDAYNVFFKELMLNTDMQVEFFNGIIPAEEVQEFAAQMEEREKQLRAQQEQVPPWIAENRDPSEQELRKMTSEQLQEAYVRRAQRDKEKAPE